VAGQDQARAGPARQVSPADCRAIFDAVSDAILIHDAQTGAILDVNQGMCEMFGYTPEEARQLSVMALGGGEAEPQAEYLRNLLAKAAAGSPQVFEWQARDRGGRVFWVEVHLKPVRLNGGDLILAMLRDIDQRKQAEEALQTQTRVLESMAEGVTVTDGDGRIIYANPAFDAMFGYQPGELIGQHVSVLNDFSTSESVRFAQAMVGQLQTKGFSSGEVRNRKKDGTRFYTQARISALEISGKTCWILVQEDITERKQFEDALRQSEAKYRTLVEQIPAITYIISLAEKVNLRYVSPQIETLLGFSPEEWRGEATETWKQQIHPEDRERVLAELAHSFQSGEPFATEYRLLAKSGRVVWFRDEARVVYDQEGEFLFLQGLALDITERRQAEAAFRETTQTLQALIQAAPLAIMAIDRDFRIRLWNAEAERMFGWKESEVLGGSLPFFQENQRSEAQARLQRQMAGEVEAALELRRVRKDGALIDTHLWTANLRDTQGEIIGLMGIMDDITARKRAQEELRRQAELLNLAHDAILVRDLDNRIVFWNAGAEETYGWRREEVQGQETHKLLHTEFSQPRAELEAEFFRQGQWQGELTHMRRDGRRIVVTSRWALQRDKEGKPAAILEINRDITERKQAEAGRARSAAILDATSDLVGTADLKGRVLFLNRAGRKMLGIGVDEDVSRLRVKDLQPEWAFRLILEQGGAEARRHEVWSGETAFLSRSGQEIPTSQVIVAHKDPEGQVEFFSTIARDITASKRGAEALQESEQELRLLTARLLSIQEQERRRVARELHDELGQALTVLKMHLVAIEEQLSLDQQHQRATCEQMLSYIDTVIENVRRLSWDLSPSSLEDLGLSSALGYLVDEICRNHNLHSTVAMDEIDHLFSPETQINIYRIFQESLTNVVKHARASLVAVKVKKEDGKVSFTIRDNGRGFNLRRAISRKVPPQSLGLTAMNERALMAAGFLQISSRKGRGTTISFAIPTDTRVK
jgi:PAS domain S-box-containing protein